MIKLLYTNKMDSATVTAKSEASANYPATNVQDRYLKKLWRSTGVTAEWLKFDLGSSSQLTLFTFFYNNLTSGATVKLYGHASNLGDTEAAWAGASYSTTITNFDQRACVLSLSETYRWWLLTITDSSNADGYVQIGRVFAGVSLSPVENFNENFSETFIDPSDIYWSVGQHQYSVQRERFKQIDFTFVDIDQTDQQTLRDFYASVYKTEPFVLALDTDSEPVDLTRYGVLTSDLNFQWSANNRASSNFSFRELR